MELKAELKQPFEDNEKYEFIAQQNHKLGYEIRYVDDGLEAWGYTEEEKAELKKKNIAQLSMTRGDVFEAMILAKGLGKAQLRAMIEQAELDTVTKALYLNRFDEALEFYRGYPIFDMLGEALGITGEMLDKFFETKDYHYLTTCKLTINATPEEATVTGVGSYSYGTIVDYKVELEGYKPYTGSVELLEDTVVDIELEKITCKLEINAVPENATVTITPNPVPYSETIHYKVECEGYIPQEDDIIMLKDETLDIALVKEESEQPVELTEPDEVDNKETSDGDENKEKDNTEETDSSNTDEYSTNGTYIGNKDSELEDNTSEETDNQEKLVEKIDE